MLDIDRNVEKHKTSQKFDFQMIIWRNDWRWLPNTGITQISSNKTFFKFSFLYIVNCLNVYDACFRVSTVIRWCSSQQGVAKRLRLPHFCYSSSSSFFIPFTISVNQWQMMLYQHTGALSFLFLLLLSLLSMCMCVCAFHICAEVFVCWECPVCECMFGAHIIISYWYHILYPKASRTILVICSRANALAGNQWYFVQE